MREAFLPLLRLGVIISKMKEDALTGAAYGYTKFRTKLHTTPVLVQNSWVSRQVCSSTVQSTYRMPHLRNFACKKRLYQIKLSLFQNYFQLVGAYIA